MTKLLKRYKAVVHGALTIFGIQSESVCRTKSRPVHTVASS